MHSIMIKRFDLKSVGQLGLTYRGSEGKKFFFFNLALRESNLDWPQQPPTEKVQKLKHDIS